MSSRRLRTLRLPAALVSCCLAGCVALPVPHKSIRNSRIFGFVVDADTGAPIAGANVEIDDPGSFYGGVRTTTVQDGSFDLPAEKVWGYLVVLAFLPFEREVCRDTLRVWVSVNESESDPSRYRTQTLEIRSCPPSPLLLHSSGEPPVSADNVGEIRLKKLPPQDPDAV